MTVLSQQREGRVEERVGGGVESMRGPAGLELIIKNFAI